MKYLKWAFGIIVALLGAVFFLNKKREEAEIEKKLIETKVKDQALAEQQVLVDQAIQTLDDGIAEMQRKKELEDRKRAEDKLSLKERADRLRQQQKDKYGK